MKIPWFWLLSMALLTFTGLMLSVVSTTLWFSVLGYFPAPMFWLILIVYVGVTRPLWEATLTSYLLCAVCAPFTAFPAGGLLIYFLSLSVVLLLVRERVFWGGSTYFMLMVAGSSLTAPLLFWLTSRFVDRNPLGWPAIFDWLISACLTSLLSYPIYHLCQWFDKIAEQDAGSESRLGPR